MADSLDLSRLLLFHSGLSMAAALSYSPFYNLPVALYGLLVVEKKETEGGGDSVRQFSAILAGSFLLDIFWLLSSWRHETSTLAMMLIVMNFVLKVLLFILYSLQPANLLSSPLSQPITFLAALGHLRQRGEPTFSFPGGFPDAASNFLGGQGSAFPPRSNQTMWQAPASSYHQGSQEEEEEVGYNSQPPPQAQSQPKPPPQQQRAGPPLRTGGAGPGGVNPASAAQGQVRSEGGGYHTLE